MVGLLRRAFAKRPKGAPQPALPSGRLAFGRPRPLPLLAPMGNVARDLEAIDARSDHPGYGLTAARIVQIFIEAEHGRPRRQCELFDDLIENDGHLRNLFDQRSQAVAGKPWSVQPEGPSAESALASEVLSSALGRQDMIRVFEHLLTFNRYGFAAAEIDWGVQNFKGRDWVVPSYLVSVPARRFVISNGPLMGQGAGEVDELRLVNDLTALGGEALAPGKWLQVRRNGTRVSRAGLMRTASWYAMAKRFGFRDWVVLSEKFGLPLLLAKYKEGASDEAVETAKEIIRNLGSDGGAAVESTIEVDIHEAGRTTDNSSTHGGLIGHCNREMSKLINGSTLANDNADSGSASYALGQVHDSVRWDNVVYDAERVQEAFRTQLFEPFMRFNGLNAPAPKLAIDVARDLSPLQRSQIGERLQKMGVPISIAQLRRETGFHAPINDADNAKATEATIGGVTP